MPHKTNAINYSFTFFNPVKMMSPKIADKKLFSQANIKIETLSCCTNNSKNISKKTYTNCIRNTKFTRYWKNWPHGSNVFLKMDKTYW